MEKKLPYSRTYDQQVQINKRKSDVGVTPSAIMYGYGNTNSQIHIVLMNVKTQTIKIHPRTFNLLGSLHENLVV